METNLKSETWPFASIGHWLVASHNARVEIWSFLCQLIFIEHSVAARTTLEEEKSEWLRSMLSRSKFTFVSDLACIVLSTP